MNQLIALYLSSLLVAVISSFAVMAFAAKWGFVDCPSERSSHIRPTPKGGGIGILATFILASAVLQIPGAFWIPATFLALLSFFGDRYNLSPKVRLPFHFVAAIIVVQFMNYGSDLSIIVHIAMAVFIVGTANCYNFMDGINGIAGLTGLIGFGFVALFGTYFQPNQNIATLALCLASACLGFLPFNFPKAKLFMGDVGSILLGFVYAAMVVVLSKSILDFVCLSAFLFPFYADELVTMTVRINNRENLLLPHRKHYYQLLANEMGIDHWKVSLGYGLMQIVVGILILLARPFGFSPVAMIIFAFFIAFVFANLTIRKRITIRSAQTL